MKKSKKPVSKKIPSTHNYDKVDILFHAKEIQKAIKSKIDGDKILAKHYGWDERVVIDNSELREFHNQLFDFMNEVHENW
jgi:hypothetical protein